MAVLVVVLAVLVVSYASSMRAYLQQRAHINDLHARIDSSQRDIKALEREKRRWQDDAYVETQARERFGWVMPGETGYQVIDRNGRPMERGDELTDPDSMAQAGPGPVVGQGLRNPRGRRPPEEDADTEVEHHPAPDRAHPLARPVSSTSAGNHSGIAEGDVAAVAAQLGRPPRSIHAVAHRCPCGNPDVVATEPRLDDGTPFPTTFYLTCPRAASMIGTLEASGLMREMTQRLAEDDELAAAYLRAHHAYLAARAEIGEVPEIAGVSAGGMPDRVKCLHVLAGQALAQGRGANPLGDEVLDVLGDVVGATAPVVEASEPSRNH